MNRIVVFSISAALAAVVAGATLAHDGAHFSAGEPGDAKRPARLVPVTMKETDDGKMLYFPSSIAVKKGEQVRFVITNAGKVPHEFVLASTDDNMKHAALMQKYPDMEHDDPNGKTLQPGQKTEMLWRFSKPGTFEFACLIPGHREAGMLGSVSVK
jgi:uncharacterized cupredoxin-like copper-binding protein